MTTRLEEAAATFAKLNADGRELEARWQALDSEAKRAEREREAVFARILEVHAKAEEARRALVNLAAEHEGSDWWDSWRYPGRRRTLEEA